MVTEREEQEYDNYRNAENTSLANDVLREISKKPMMLIEGARVVPERQIWSLLAPADGVPTVSYTHLDVYKRQVLGYDNRQISFTDKQN